MEKRDARLGKAPNLVSGKKSLCPLVTASLWFLDKGLQPRVVQIRWSSQW